MFLEFSLKISPSETKLVVDYGCCCEIGSEKRNFFAAAENVLNHTQEGVAEHASRPTSRTDRTAQKIDQDDNIL